MNLWDISEGSESFKATNPHGMCALSRQTRTFRLLLGRLPHDPRCAHVGKKVQMSLVDYCATFVCRIFNADVVLIPGNLDECPRKDSPNGPRSREQRSPW